VDTFRAGSIVRERYYWDSASLARQLADASE
jgi:ketosteroid isomerase-like protein